MGFICAEMHCHSPATLYQSVFSVAPQMCVRDSFLYLSTSLSYRATERLPNLAHRALPFFVLLFELPSWLRENHVFVFYAVFVRFFQMTYSPTEVLAAQGDHICLRCTFAEQESAALIKLVTVCLPKKGMSLWFYFPETIMTTLWSTSNASSLHSWFIWLAFETSFWSFWDHCGSGLAHQENLNVAMRCLGGHNIWGCNQLKLW